MLQAIDVLGSGLYFQHDLENPGEIRIAFASSEPISIDKERLFVIEFQSKLSSSRICPIKFEQIQIAESLLIEALNGSIEFLPDQSVLLQNYPNPFNPDTWIPFDLADRADVSIWIYDMTGSLIRTFELGDLSAGSYISKERAVHWDGKNDAGEKVSSGVYFYKISADDFSPVKKMVIRK